MFILLFTVILLTHTSCIPIQSYVFSLLNVFMFELQKSCILIVLLCFLRLIARFRNIFTIKWSLVWRAVEKHYRGSKNSNSRRFVATGTEYVVCNVCTQSIINHEVEFKEQTEREKQYSQLVVPQRMTRVLPEISKDDC